MSNRTSARVIERQQWNSRLCSLRLDLALPPFEAGQFVSLGLEIEGKTIMRPYSLVNAPDAEYHEIFFNRVPDGPLSNRLFDLQPGDQLLSAQKAGGFFTLSQVPAAQHLWLLATGTALGPYLSILRTPAPWESYERVILVHGVREHSEMAYLPLIEEIKQRHKHQFDFFYSVTREQESPHFSQRIPELLDQGELENKLGISLNPELDQIMLCGNNGMVNASLAVLNERGFKKNQRRDPGQITIEIYQ
jgi:ferredoxin--NADP+ reductase